MLRILWSRKEQLSKSHQAGSAKACLTGRSPMNFAEGLAPAIQPPAAKTPAKHKAP
jgi:hypothetical protein